MWPRLALDSTLLPQALSCCWGSSCITTPIQWMLNFCHFLPCKYFNVFKVIWFQPSTIRSFLSCLYYKHSCDPQVVPLHSALRSLLSNVVTRHMEMQPCMPRTLAFVLASLIPCRGHWFVLMLTERKCWGHWTWGQSSACFWRQVPLTICDKSWTFSMEKVCTRKRYA